MKLPNLRLHETRATASVWLGGLGLLCVLALAYCVFRGFNLEHKTIPYNARVGIGRFRPYLVYGWTASSLLIGAISAFLGFGSLGQKRNKKQGRSWMGLFIGAIAVSTAPVLLYAWMRFSERAIVGG